MAKTTDAAARFSKLRGTAGDMDEQARADMTDLTAHHRMIDWTPEQIEELRADFRHWWKSDAAAARQCLAEAAAEARKFMDALAARCRQAEANARAARAAEREAA